MSRARKILIVLGALVGALIVALIAAVVIADEPLPEGESGPAADALARELMASVKLDAWEKTGAVAWDFGGRQQHLWDRDRMLARVTWGDHVAWIDLDTRQGVVHVAGQPVAEAEARPLLDKAYAFWANDSFWLNPLAKLFDEGVTRSLVKTETGPALLVSYAAGGVTPGDAYLWHRGDDGRPTMWQMWVSVLPVGGLSATWDGWVTTETGALVSSRHSIGGLLDLELSDIRAAADIGGLAPDGDPFAALGR